MTGSRRRIACELRKVTKISSRRDPLALCKERGYKATLLSVLLVSEFVPILYSHERRNVELSMQCKSFKPDYLSAYAASALRKELKKHVVGHACRHMFV